MKSFGRFRVHHGREFRRFQRGTNFWIPAAIGMVALYVLLANFIPWLPAVAIERGPYYQNCDAARAAGVTPLRIGEPGYRPQLDRDRDGWACEPLPRR